MPMPAKKPATTPIPVHASEPELNPFILTHLSIPRFEAVLLDVKLATTSYIKKEPSTNEKNVSIVML